jgi:ATP-binding cassette, subfamily B, bacterial
LIGPRTRKFLSYYKPYLGILIADLVCAGIVAAVSLVFPLLTRAITKNVLASPGPHALEQILTMGAWMLGLVAIQAACNYFVDAQGHAMGARMESDLRDELFAHYQSLPFGFYDDQKTGQLMSRITHDLLSLAELYHHAPEDIVIYLVKFFGAFAILLSINRQLTLVAFAFLPINLNRCILTCMNLRGCSSHPPGRDNPGGFQ